LKNLNFEILKNSEKNEILKMGNLELSEIKKKIILGKKEKVTENNTGIEICNDNENNNIEIGLKFLKEILRFKLVQIKIKNLKEKENFISEFNNFSFEDLLNEYINSDKNLRNFNELIENFLKMRKNLKDLYNKKRNKLIKFRNIYDKINL